MEYNPDDFAARRDSFIPFSSAPPQAQAQAGQAAQTLGSVPSHGAVNKMGSIDEQVSTAAEVATLKWSQSSRRVAVDAVDGVDAVV